MPILQIFPINALKDNYIWAIVDASHKNALIVDPGDAAPVNAFLQKNKLDLKGILLTHHHWDHTNAALELSHPCQTPIIGPSADNISSITIHVKEGDHIALPGFPLTLNVMDIPGHTLGHIAYYTDNILFCGDTLFAAGCGRLFEGTANQLYHSLQKLASLPEDTHIYCGHEYTLHNLAFAQEVEPNNHDITMRIHKVTDMRNKHQPSLPSTIKEELKTNPFLRCTIPDVIKSAENHANKQLSDPVEVFTELRKWKDRF